MMPMAQGIQEVLHLGDKARIPRADAAWSPSFT